MTRHTAARTVAWCAWLCALLAAALCVTGPADAAAPAPVSQCTATAGTIVAVDFAHWSGPIVRGCDRGNPRTGAQLLTDEGFTLAGTTHDGPAFVCRIGNAAWSGGTQYPTPAQDPCVVTPPASAYWSYWRAAPGSDTWSYAQGGAYATQQSPQPGGVELWTFGGTHVTGGRGEPVDGFPSCSPDSLRAHGSPTPCTASTPPPGSTSASSAPAPTSSATSTSAHSTTTPPTHTSTSPTRPPASTHATPTRVTSTPVTSTHASTTTPARTSPTSPATAPPPESTQRTTQPGTASVPPPDASTPPASGAPSPGAVGSTTGTGAPSSAPVVVQARPASASRSTGSATPLVIALVIAAVLLGGGGAAVWRRRRAAQE